jgi:hypothetical protein
VIRLDGGEQQHSNSSSNDNETDYFSLLFVAALLDSFTENAFTVIEQINQKKQMQRHNA